MGYVCGNVLEARDIAAIQNDNDINQLFKFSNNEAEYCTCFSSVEEWGEDVFLDIHEMDCSP